MVSIGLSACHLWAHRRLSLQDPSTTTRVHNSPVPTLVY